MAESLALACCVALAALIGPATGRAQDAGDPAIVLRGGWLFDGVSGRRTANPTVVVRGGVFARIGIDPDGGEPRGARVIEIERDATILPGLFDLHAHFGVELLGRGRVDETEYNPRLFLANGVTSVFPAGEMNPDKVRAAQRRIARGELPGPRIFRSGPYFGTARPGWRRAATAAEIRDEVDRLAAEGVTGFKAKGIGAEHLRALIEQAHRWGLTVTGHLGSGHRGSVNPRDAIAMGIDRVEHFLGGDALPASRSAYASLVEVDARSDEIAAICRLFVARNVYFDATLTAYGYYGAREPAVFDRWRDEREFFTPYVRERVAARERRVHDRFERIYRVKRATLKALHDAGGAHLITLGTDHPSQCEFAAGFGAHRELHALTLAGITPADALRIGTINGARALGLGDRLGTIETGKLADLFIVRGDPLEDIRATRDVTLVMCAGRVHDPDELLASAVGKIGPRDADDVGDWVLRWRRR